MPNNGRQLHRPTRLKVLYGDLPRHVSGPNAGRLNRRAVAARYGLSLKQVTKAYLNWQDIFRMPGSMLTFEAYLTKLADSGIVPDNVGNHEGQFNLARINDAGPYNSKSCRFIKRTENIREQKNLFGRRVRT